MVNRICKIQPLISSVSGYCSFANLRWVKVTSKRIRMLLRKYFNGYFVYYFMAAYTEVGQEHSIRLSGFI